MKKVLISMIAMAVLAVSGVAMAQDAEKKVCDKQKTEKCDKKCDKKEEACTKDAKCCDKGDKKEACCTKK